MTDEDFQENVHKGGREAIGFRRGVRTYEAEFVREQSSVDECPALRRDSRLELVRRFVDALWDSDMLILYKLLVRLERKVAVEDAEGEAILGRVV